MMARVLRAVATASMPSMMAIRLAATLQRFTDDAGYAANDDADAPADGDDGDDELASPHATRMLRLGLAQLLTARPTWISRDAAY